eukprot:TRINITY_DN15380_c0_g1_i1.p1 TRINITY_DN15380_c0_g1~~TRINITY_DN15380_c0_g1_i1.p1  ORF type:complete len:332 (+),score=62.22 TRINITY_DN15380_c0_g1_i1:119-1114(+)
MLAVPGMEPTMRPGMAQAASTGQIGLRMPMGQMYQEGTHHQRLQFSMLDRAKGGPNEQVRSAAHRLRGTRCCEVLHSSLEDPLSSYKTLEPLRPHMQFTMRKFHLGDGYKCFDADTIVVPARDSVQRTRTGLLRSSTGLVTYSDTHRKKVELDVQELARILANEGQPEGGHFWTARKLERVFRYRTGRCGSWGHYEVPFVEFLTLFPRTFAIFNNGENVRLRSDRKSTVVDVSEDALIRLARARHTGHVEQWVKVMGSQHKTAEPNILPELQHHRMKCVYKPYGEYSQPQDSAAATNYAYMHAASEEMPSTAARSDRTCLADPRGFTTDHF